MKCYFQGCTSEGTTKEHIPPKSFFPNNDKNQLLTVKSCELHNNEKSSDDLYTLAHICINSSPKNKSRDIFNSRILPQLEFNNGSFRKLLSKNSIIQENGSVVYEVDIRRLNNFFTALSCGIIFKIAKKSLPNEYEINHIYHNLVDKNETEAEKLYKEQLINFYSNNATSILDFGDAKAINKTIYSVKVFGITNFKSSITIVHEFYGTFRVTSMLTRVIQ